MNPIIDQMLGHRSIRKFTDDPVADQDIAAAVDAGQMASTSGAIQSYCLLRIRDESTRQQLVELTGGQSKVERCGAFFIVCGDTRRHRLLAERSNEPYETRLEAFLLATIDASLFAQNLALAFESMGYGICYIGGLRNDLDGVQSVLNCPIGVYPLFGLCVGRPADDPALRPRLPRPAVLFDDRYPGENEMLATLDDFNESMLSYYQKRGAGDRSWNIEMVRKFAEPRRVSVGPYYRSRGANLD